MTNDFRAPDVPPHLVKCIEKKAPPSETADGMVASELKTSEERQACSRALLQWYEGIKKAQSQGIKKLEP